MYTDHEGQEQDLQKKDVMNCLDQEQMQAMQDQFCQTQGVYCVCVSRNMRRLTISFSGTKEEQNFIDRVFPVATQRIYRQFFGCRGRRCDRGRIQYAMCAVARNRHP